jgi:hypothetical protein
MLRVLAALGAALAIAGCAAAEGASAPKPKCPPPPEPAFQSVVVGTIGKLHMVESRYPLARLADVMTAFKPDLVLVAVRVDPFREGHLEDASFEMTYAAHLARSRGVPIEPIDWFRQEDLGAAPPAVDPPDERTIASREADVLLQPKLYTFEQANGAALAEKILLATNAEARHRAGNAPATRRTAWIQHLAADAVLRHSRPKRVLAVVDVFDRPAVDLVLHGVGYDGREPASVTRTSEAISAELPAEVLTEYRAQLDRTRDRAAKARSAPERAFWRDRSSVLAVAVDKRAACCVPQSAFAASTSDE